MRNSSAIYQASPPRFRVLLLLLIQIHLALAAPTAYDSPTYTQTISAYETVTGGSTLTKMQRLESRCSGKFVSMGFEGKINAKGDKNAYSVLIFESHASGGGKVKIKSNATRKYLCFSKHGKLIDRQYPARNDEKCIFHEKSIGNSIMLQSVANSGWKVGFYKKGNKMKAPFRKKNQKCFKFAKLELMGDPPILKGDPWPFSLPLDR
ncbi:unnamed protein product [Lymnaea stagnalis]|uniref:FGF n=1 Tax=Lymnaea stagnalis TaxID=6523 RepID=A0AAV2II47_LYMST